MSSATRGASSRTNCRVCASGCTLDLVVANAENIADGAGVTAKTANELFAAGVDVLTNGNHAWDKKEALEYIKAEPRLLRPHNYPDGTPGSGWFVATTAQGHKGRHPERHGQRVHAPAPRLPVHRRRPRARGQAEDVKMVFVDLHAEVTSEKMGMGWYLDGRASAVVGTHTHVPTADERILPQGTGYITDVGMTGCYHSVIGMDIAKSLKRLIQKLPERFDVAEARAACVRCCSTSTKTPAAAGISSASAWRKTRRRRKRRCAAWCNCSRFRPPGHELLADENRAGLFWSVTPEEPAETH